MRYPKITRLVLQYALARYSLIGASVLPLMALADYLYLHRTMRLDQIFSGPNLPLLAGAAALSLVALRYRKSVLNSIDRHFFSAQHEPAKRKKGRIQVPPGFRLQALAKFVFSHKTYSEIYEPILRDLWEEYCEVVEKQPWKAHYVRVRGYWSFWSAVFAQLPMSLVNMIYKIWKATR
jgi:hypothetical protein